MTSSQAISKTSEPSPHQHPAHPPSASSTPISSPKPHSPNLAKYTPPNQYRTTRGFGTQNEASGHISDRRYTEQVKHLQGPSPLGSAHSVRTLTPRRRQIHARAFLITASQLPCLILLGTYELCRDEASCPHLATSLPTPLALILRLETPSTTLFVFTALAYGTLAALQYEINRQDRFQRLFLIVGILMGTWIWNPSVPEAGGHHVVVFPLALSITAALVSSAVGHWIGRMFCGSGEGEGALDTELLGYEKGGNDDAA